MHAFDLPGILRRIRRLADLSQRELARGIAISKSAVAAAETGSAGLDARVLAAAAALADLRLALVDGDGQEVNGMDSGTVRDLGGRLFPAHLDPRYTTEEWWEGVYRRGRVQPWYTFDRDRRGRDVRRVRHGTPEDHQLPRPGDSPAARAAARRQAALARQRDRTKRLRIAGLLPPWVEFECLCPPQCDELDDRSGAPVHASDCRCRCDVD